MRKYKGFIIGLIVGLILATTGTVFADSVSSMIGKQVDITYPVYVNGNRLQVDAISIGGKSFIPTTDYAETAGYAVYFDVDAKTINLDLRVDNMPGMKGITKTQDGLISDDPNISTIITPEGTYYLPIDTNQDRNTQTQRAGEIIVKTNELTKAQSKLAELQTGFNQAHLNYLSTGYPEERWPETASYKTYTADIADQQAVVAKLQAELNALQ